MLNQYQYQSLHVQRLERTCSKEVPITSVAMVGYFHKEPEIHNVSQPKDDEDRNVSYFKIFRSICIFLIIGAKIIHSQYLLFYEEMPKFEDSDPANVSIPVIYFLSGVIATAFSVRIYNLEKLYYTTKFTTGLIVSCVFVSIHIYFSVIMNAKLQTSEKYQTSSHFEKMFTAVVPAMFLFLQILPFLCYLFVVVCAIECKFAKTSDQREEKFFDLIDADANADFISILDCYLRSGPQLIVQIAEIISDKWSLEHVSEYQIFFNVVAFLIIPWSITSFQGSVRQQHHTIISWKAKAVYFLWHFFIIESRIVCISCAVAFWPSHTKVLIAAHWVVMTVWLLNTTEPTDFCNKNYFWHILFCCVFGAVYFFNPVKLDNRPTRFKYFAFYLLIFIEDLVGNVGWYIKDTELIQVWKITFFGLNFSSFLFGIIFMVIYYIKFHPNKSLLTNDNISSKAHYEVSVDETSV